ncbi:MAG: aminotransferase class III-fold pyridoxal phosphate-dependent enzyme, partial [Gemmatimonadetes bacterium]|nr:aminotransferase class III-fold pyridoxal phosphate-dependent enzyme [Gemmatimonadota bacterium]
MIRTYQRPAYPLESLERLLRERWGYEGVLRPLPGERDLNFLLETGERKRFVVKLASPEEPDEILAWVTDLLAWLDSEESAAAPRLVPTRDGATMAREDAVRVRVLEHVPGVVLAEVRPWRRELLRDLGRQVGALDAALARYDVRPPARDEFSWALAEAGAVMARGRELVDDPRRRDLLDDCRRSFEAVGPACAQLPTQVIHADVNEHNVLVSDEVGAAPRVTGILDFGDAHEAPAVFDLAITLAYATLRHADPLQAAAAVVAGYHETRPLSDHELDVLFALWRARLGASVSIAASRRGPGGDVDPYLLVSEAPAWAALGATATVPPHLARGILRAACGLPACPRSPSIVSWIEARADVMPVMDAPSDADAVGVLDLSVGSPLLTGRDTDDTPAFTRRVFDEMRARGWSLAVGRYLEPRGFYLTEAFAGRPAEMPERRTVHMGIDLFDEPGAAVRAPVDGTVKSVRVNADRLDYGPTVILEHATPEGPFWTLYGHLEHASVAGLVEGSRVKAGDIIARVGPYPENGDWPPHLHFQIITDLLGYEGDFPGVAAPREVEAWASFSPDPNLLLRLPLPMTYRPPVGLDERRMRLLGPSLSLSYREPIHVVRGIRQHLFDASGRQYLDCVNNVAHVGHEHPEVVEAGRRQMAVLNTNTRYLHQTVLDYAERLAALFPPPLSVCFFVNSGSEANELALRMARAHTGGRGVVVLEGGYHGNTQGLIDVSHYKFAGKGGSGPPPWVAAAPMPDEYRGRWRRDDPDRAARYASGVEEAATALHNAGYAPAAFLAETVLSCGGQVVPPAGYLADAYRRARAGGAVCIADEVQVGLGRVGTHMWGFQTQDALPDIVTLGKPIGNGHPLGAVVTTPEIARSFANGMEFFSTFGGNPVSAAVGFAVLEVMDREALRDHALRVGGELKEGLASLMGSHPVVGDVRGLGLFLGIEIIAPPDARERSAPG